MDSHALLLRSQYPDLKASIRIFNSLDVSEATRKDYSLRIDSFLSFIQVNGFNRSSYLDFKATPSVVFTIPPLATVGLTEKQAKDKGYDYTVKFEDTTSWYSSKRINEEISGYKTIVDKRPTIFWSASHRTQC